MDRILRFNVSELSSSGVLEYLTKEKVLVSFPDTRAVIDTNSVKALVVDVNTLVTDIQNNCTNTIDQIIEYNNLFQTKDKCLKIYQFSIKVSEIYEAFEDWMNYIDSILSNTIKVLSDESFFRVFFDFSSSSDMICKFLEVLNRDNSGILPLLNQTTKLNAVYLKNLGTSTTVEEAMKILAALASKIDCNIGTCDYSLAALCGIKYISCVDSNISELYAKYFGVQLVLDLTPEVFGHKCGCITHMSLGKNIAISEYVKEVKQKKFKLDTTDKVKKQTISLKGKPRKSNKEASSSVPKAKKVLVLPNLCNL